MMKKLMVTACVGLSLILGCATVSMAGGKRCNVTVTKIGSTISTNTTSGHVLVATGGLNTCQEWGTSTSNNFYLHSTNGDAMLATALTAVSLNKQLAIHTVGDSFKNWGIIEQVYMSN